jgi:hypothetical protein
MVLAGSFCVAIAMGLWSWGTWIGWGCLAFALVAHVTSALDALRQSSFPVYPRRVALALTSAVMGFVCYLPTALLLSVVAWPGMSPEGAQCGYLVNCWAYRSAKPSPGECIWVRLRSSEARAAHVVALPGQEVEWTGKSWRVDGHDRPLHARFRLTGSPQPCRFRVPESHVLVEPEELGVATPLAGPLVLVGPEAIIGRAWAQIYPVWERRLL